MNKYLISKLIGGMSDEELGELMLLIVKKYRVEIEVIFEKMSKIVGDEEVMNFINNLKKEDIKNE